MKDTKLIISIEALREEVEKSNSTGRTFLLGVVRGVGAVIGATIVAGLLLGWASFTFKSLGEVPVIGPLFSSISETIPADYGGNSPPATTTTAQ